MKTITMLLTLLLVVSACLAQAGEYYEIEEWNADATGIVYDPDPNAPMHDVVWFYDRYGCRRYTTRVFAQRMGLTARGYYPYWRRYRPLVYYPGRYRREIRYERKRGLLTRILEFLL